MVMSAFVLGALYIPIALVEAVEESVIELVRYAWTAYTNARKLPLDIDKN